MDPLLKSKLNKLRELYPDDDSAKMISDIERGLRVKIAQSGLKDLEVVQDIIAEAKRKISGINMLLQFDEELTEEKRKSLFKERTVHQFYLDRFDTSDSEAKLDQLNQYLDSKIKDVE
jgi:hypothetical protein